MIDTEKLLADVADRWAIRELVDSYAHSADRRDPDGQAAVFARHGQVRLFEAEHSTTEPVQVITGRDALAATFADLIHRYDSTTYLNGQSTITVQADTAAAESYCMAYHLLQDRGERILLTMAIRYLDHFERTSEGWRIAQRDLVFDWRDRRPSSP